MTAAATDVHMILDELQRRYAPQPASRWWWVALGGFLLVCTAAGGAFGWAVMMIAMQPGACR